jgi:TPR repeat protein
MISRNKLTVMILATCIAVFGAIPETHAAEAEDVFWKSVTNGNVVEEYEAYLTQYPKGKYVAEARRRIRLLEAPVATRPPAGENRQSAGEDENLVRGRTSLDRKDYPEALLYFRKAAAQGDAKAQNNLGVMYDNGLGVAQDYKEAMKWYRLAAAKGLATAQTNLGLMYYNSQGVAQDYKEAMKWFRLAADQGAASAQFNLGQAYRNGQGVTQDYKEAVKWYRLAADQGDADAQFNLGAMYANGEGVAANRVVAYALFNLSAANDPSSENPATKNRTNLAASMSASEIESAQTLTREFAKPGNLLAALDKYAQR